MWWKRSVPSFPSHTFTGPRLPTVDTYGQGGTHTISQVVGLVSGLWLLQSVCQRLWTHTCLQCIHHSVSCSERNCLVIDKSAVHLPFTPIPLRPQWACPHWVRFSVYCEQFVYLKWLVLFISETWQRKNKISQFSQHLCAPCGSIKKIFLCLMKRIIPKIGKVQPCYSIWLNPPQLCASLTIMSGRLITVRDFNSCQWFIRIMGLFNPVND